MDQNNQMNGSNQSEQGGYTNQSEQPVQNQQTNQNIDSDMQQNIQRDMSQGSQQNTQQSMSQAEQQSTQRDMQQGTQQSAHQTSQPSDGLYHYSYINNPGDSRYDRRFDGSQSSQSRSSQNQSRAYSGFERNVNGMEAWYDSQRMSRGGQTSGQYQTSRTSGMNAGGSANGSMAGMNGAQQTGQGTGMDGRQTGTAGMNMSNGSGRSERRSRKKKDKAGKKKGTGMKVFSLIAAAVVFGLVAGAVFQGVRYGTDKALGKDTTQTASATTTTTEATTESNTPQLKSASTVSTTYDVASVAEKVMPSIVSITGTYVTTYQSWFDSYQQESTGCGSGIIIGKDDDYLYIATNYHVVEDSKELSATFVDDSSADATIKGYVENNDIAVLTVNLSDISDDTLSQIKEITVGSSDSLKVGDPCVAIGNALGYGQSVTVGYISALNREISTSDETVTVLQTDAAINPGNSGGALVNMNGELIGINTAKYSDTSVEGMGYALPISDVQDIINDLIAGKSVASDGTTTGQTYLGVVGQTITSQYSQLLGMPEGVYVSSVESGSAAEECGLQSGDIICSLDGEDVTDMDTFHDKIVAYNAGDKVTIVFYRNNNGNYEKQTVTATLQAKE